MIAPVGGVAVQDEGAMRAVLGWILLPALLPFKAWSWFSAWMDEPNRYLNEANTDRVERLPASEVLTGERLSPKDYR